MASEKFDLENLDKERRKAVANSIRTMSVEELKALGNEIFRYADDPWREKFFGFIAENPGATFHHAVMSDGVTSFTAAIKIRACGSSRGAAWGHCKSRAGR